MWDYETQTYWDHITGEAVHGALKGYQLDIWGVEMTTVEAALAEYEKITFYDSSHRSLLSMFQGFVFRFLHGDGYIHGTGGLPPHFRETMQETDKRLPEMTQGLGIFEDEQAIFYPMDVIPAEGIEDTWQGRRICIRKGEIDRVPYAVYMDDTSERPMQLLTRWYGFSLTFPETAIYGE